MILHKTKRYTVTNLFNQVSAVWNGRFAVWNGHFAVWMGSMLCEMGVLLCEMGVCIGQLMPRKAVRWDTRYYLSLTVINKWAFGWSTVRHIRGSYWLNECVMKKEEILLQRWRCLCHLTFHRWRKSGRSNIAVTPVSCATGHASAALEMETQPEARKVRRRWNGWGVPSPTVIFKWAGPGSNVAQVCTSSFWQGGWTVLVPSAEDEKLVSLVHLWPPMWKIPQQKSGKRSSRSYPDAMAKLIIPHWMMPCKTLNNCIYIDRTGSIALVVPSRPPTWICCRGLPQKLGKRTELLKCQACDH